VKFAPKPENDFAQYIRTYYDECRSRFGKIEAIAGKWMFRDLLPGMSDFDTRFIVSDDMTVQDWCDMSTAVGEVHLSLCTRYPCWARNLEHLPGVNLTWNELTSEVNYYPEYHQWTYYHSENHQRLGESRGVLAKRPWDIKDEYFHLKKFCLYYGRYDRSIDRAINMGVHENKYPLHSRIMHYFSPPVMSAMCLLEKRGIAGKLDAFEMAERAFPELECWEAIREILHEEYEAPRWYAEPQLVELEDMLEHALLVIAERLADGVTLLPDGIGVDIPAWKAALANVKIDPAMVIFDNAKFCRLMKGRLNFYARSPRHFDATYLIQIELKRIGPNFFRTPFAVYWKLRTGESVTNPIDILPSLQGDLLTDSEVEAVREFDRLAPGHWEPGTERETALAIAGVFDTFFSALAKICGATLEIKAS
jgi:hypothetical protein